jgi:hypothetical protein
MLQVRLLVTGDMEVKSLAQSFQSQFPAERDGRDVKWLKPRRSQCATSHRLWPGKDPSRPMCDLARAMIAEVITGRQGDPVDLVIVVEDVELDNLGQEEVIADHFRRAVLKEFAERAQAWDMRTVERNRQRVQACCSFHVLRPMPEAYFFGDPLALQRAGIRPEVPQLRHPTDVESFEVIDTNWLPSCHAINHQHALAGRTWWLNERHPKDYLQHLLVTHYDASYSETLQGAAALAQLNWPMLPKEEGDARFVRALFQDLADWFEVDSPILGQTANAFYPEKHIRRESLLLRNM